MILLLKRVIALNFLAQQPSHTSVAKRLPHRKTPKIMISKSAAATVCASLTIGAFAQPTVQLNDFEVTNQRSFSDQQSLRTGRTIGSTELQSYNLQDLAQALNSAPSLKAYRRMSAKSAHPTTQGISFRNTGNNATSRTLVLLDGIPQNDPFGGWIFWNRYHLDAIDSINISTTGHNELWGNLGAGGLLTLNQDSNHLGRQSYSASVGSDASYSLGLGRNLKLSESVNIDIDARIFDSGGFEPIHPDQRGPLDQEAKSESQAIRTQVNWKTDSGWFMNTAIDYFQEERNNGTPLANNETEALDISFNASNFLDEYSQINLSAYYQDRGYENQFTSVDDERASEILALDQFDVPATAYGTSLTYAKTINDDLRVLSGIDVRSIKGEINERYRNLGSGFTRQRQAGGEQLFLGAFAAAHYKASDSTEFSLSTRFDRIEQNNGFRNEINTDNGNTLLDAFYEDRSDSELSLNASMTHHLNKKQAITTSVFSGFRAPTLNELYRPFRVKNDIVESNPDLVNERQQGIQISYDAQLSNTLTVGVRGFHYQLDDMVANVLMTTDAGFSPIFGFIPEGGSGSQRMNIDESTVTGFELEMSASITPTLTSILNYSYAPTEIESNAANPELVGKAFPQSPDNRIYVELNWQVSEVTRAWISSTIWDEQYDDGGNNRKLDSAYSIDLGVNWALNEKSQISLRIDNVTDTIIESGITTGGLVSISTPRTAWISYSFRN